VSIARVIIVSPEPGAITAAEEALRRHATDLAARNGIASEHVRSKLVRDVKATSRSLTSIEPWDALHIYEWAHDGPALVFPIRAPMAMRNILSGPSKANGIKLDELLRYKAFVAPLTLESRAGDIDDALARYHEWAATSTGITERDHRVLPLHIFSPRKDWPDLHSPAGVTAFEAVHGRAGSLIDGRQRHWNRANARHGTRFVWIAGSEIDGGAHWDVVATANPTELWSLYQLWTLPSGSYVNAYPNGVIRKGQSSAVMARCTEAESPASMVSTVKSRPKRRGRRGGTGR
jgi:hypothetical protein